MIDENYSVTIAARGIRGDGGIVCGAAPASWFH